MIFGIASFAVVAEMIWETPVVIQCPQATPEPWTKWLLPTLIQAFISVVSISAGVAIALWSFRATRRKDRERWILDQKVQEWRSLIVDSNETLSLIHDILSRTQVIGPFSVRSPEEQKGIAEDFRETLGRARELLHKPVVIRQSLKDARIFDVWEVVSNVLVSVSSAGVLRTEPQDKNAFVKARDGFLAALYGAASVDLNLPGPG